MLVVSNNLTVNNFYLCPSSRPSLSLRPFFFLFLHFLRNPLAPCWFQAFAFFPAHLFDHPSIFFPDSLSRPLQPSDDFRFPHTFHVTTHRDFHVYILSDISVFPSTLQLSFLALAVLSNKPVLIYQP